MLALIIKVNSKVKSLFLADLLNDEKYLLK